MHHITDKLYFFVGVAATTMQSPFVMADWPPYVTCTLIPSLLLYVYYSSLLFGTLGMILGRVITHGFNSQGKDNIIFRS